MRCVIEEARLALAPYVFEFEDAGATARGSVPAGVLAGVPAGVLAGVPAGVLAELVTDADRASAGDIAAMARCDFDRIDTWEYKRAPACGWGVLVALGELDWELATAYAKNCAAASSKISHNDPRLAEFCRRFAAFFGVDRDPARLRAAGKYLLLFPASFLISVGRALHTEMAYTHDDCGAPAAAKYSLRADYCAAPTPDEWNYAFNVSLLANLSRASPDGYEATLEYVYERSGYWCAYRSGRTMPICILSQRLLFLRAVLLYWPNGRESYNTKWLSGLHLLGRERGQPSPDQIAIEEKIIRVFGALSRRCTGRGWCFNWEFDLGTFCATARSYGEAKLFERMCVLAAADLRRGDGWAVRRAREWQEHLLGAPVDAPVANVFMKVAKVPTALDCVASTDAWQGATGAFYARRLARTGLEPGDTRYQYWGYFNLLGFMEGTVYANEVFTGYRSPRGSPFRSYMAEVGETMSTWRLLTNLEPEAHEARERALAMFLGPVNHYTAMWLLYENCRILLGTCLAELAGLERAPLVAQLRWVFKNAYLSLLSQLVPGVVSADEVRREFPRCPDIIGVLGTVQRVVAALAAHTGRTLGDDCLAPERYRNY